MKTTIKQFATLTVLSFLLLTVNANAHGRAVKHTCFDESEATLQLVSWMTKEIIWEVNSADITEFAEEAESEQIVENWMIDTEIWNFNSVFPEETEAGLTIENWMTDYNVWNVETTENETGLSVEPWMISLKKWRKTEMRKIQHHHIYCPIHSEIANQQIIKL